MAPPPSLPAPSTVAPPSTPPLGPSAALPPVSALTATQVRELARRYGFHPSQALGQNFVVDPNTIRRIVRLAEIDPAEEVLEIGAGLGTLTVALAEQAAAVIAVEIDRRAVPALTEVVGAVPNVTVVVGDAMALDYHCLLGGRPHRLVANLPYNIATPLVADLLTAVPEVTDLVFMVQREVGERLVAPPGSRVYGAVSVLVAYHAEARLLGRVPPTVFWPVPKVESVLVRLSRRPPPVAADPAALMMVVRAAFGQRRKTVRNAVTSVLGRTVLDVEAALAAAGVDPAARAETLGLGAFARLTGALAQQGPIMPGAPA